MHVIVVDPSRTVLKCVTRLLEARDHHVLPFTDGREALQVAKSDPNVDALITSVELPSMSGVELCREARQLAGNRRPIYIILMSASGERHSMVEALDNGADDFINKPPAPEELYARLRAAARLATMQRELIRQAATDSLTGLCNRRAFFEAAEDACAHVGIAPLSVIMFDLDLFKQVNDNFGHDVGDRLLREFAQVIVVEGGVVGRMGGEEFALLLPGRDTKEAFAVAEDLRRKVSELCIDTEKGPLSATCSLGVSTWQTGDDIDRLLRRADMALYAAKTGGRNQTVCADISLLIDGYPESGRIVRTGERKIVS